uniref:Uncharacterized protein n=1 Tax=Anguilla anguilla TaxID=7936 RepID=A0A0E9TUV5_ANGAN
MLFCYVRGEYEQIHYFTLITILILV